MSNILYLTHRKERFVKKKYIQYFWLLGALLFTFSCKKEAEEKTIPNNNAPYYDEVPTLLVNNYVNRLYIDLIGREPLDAEMQSDVAELRFQHLSMPARDSLINKLQTNENFIVGDTSYKRAYYQRIYDLAKAKMIEGASDAIVQKEISMLKFQMKGDSLEGDLLKYQLNNEKLTRLLNVVNINKDYRNNSITINQVFSRLLNNAIYDKINMNTFNFVQAAFNDLYLRFPTSSEFDRSYEMIEFNQPVLLLGNSGQNKNDFLNIMVNSAEFYEGIIRWSYQTILAREPSTKEVVALLETFKEDQNFQHVQKAILKTDEYANFN